MSLGNKILKLRKKEGLSQEELGEKLVLQDKLFQIGNLMKQYLIQNN